MKKNFMKETFVDKIFRIFYSVKYKILDLKYPLQKIFRGYSDIEVWNLYFHTAKYILPRLIRLYHNFNSYPTGLTPRQWREILNDMIYSFNYIIEQEKDTTYPVNNKKFTKGLKLFAKYYIDLWD